jgi:hypothetical protein
VQRFGRLAVRLHVRYLEDTGVGVRERTHLKNGETYQVRDNRHSIRASICAVMGGSWAGSLRLFHGPPGFPNQPHAVDFD